MHSAEQYAEQLAALLPPGKLAAGPGSVMRELLQALARELVRVEAAAADLLDQMDPRQALELLADWQNVVGVPDACSGDYDSSTPQVIAAIMDVLRSTGGQSRQYYVDVADSLGYPGAEIEEYGAFVAGESVCGEDLVSETSRFAWTMRVPAVTQFSFVVGESVCGDELGAAGNDRLECVIRRLAPAHTSVGFEYEETS